MCAVSENSSNADLQMSSITRERPSSSCVRLKNPESSSSYGARSSSAASRSSCRNSIARMSGHAHRLMSPLPIDATHNTVSSRRAEKLRVVITSNDAESPSNMLPCPPGGAHGATTADSDSRRRERQ